MKLLKTPFPTVQFQRRLLQLAAIFLFLYGAILTLAPAARERTWNAPLKWSHWLGFAIWIVLFALIHHQVRRRIPDSDPYLLPIAGLLTGWGMFTIWRLVPAFGLRQMLWMIFSGGIFLLGLRLSPDLNFLRRYKYVWLTGGLLLTALTLIFGTNPAGGNERLWLGCCGVYFQPSEPLKLLLIVFLSAYFADKLPLSLRLLPLVVPTMVVTGLALLVMLVQHDLGTVTILIFLYTITLFLASGKKRVLWISLSGLMVAGVVGYFLFDVIRVRVHAWVNPWIDPSGRSFQIVQSLLAIANGGTLGRGPGLGNPSLVPVAISDFVFSAIAEETGLVGTVGLLTLIGIFVARGFRIAMHAPDTFRRILAAGLSAYLGAQSILIIAGNMRLLPLTGVTLPFVSYGGSSLLTTFLALLILLLISSQPDEEPAPLLKIQPYYILSSFLGLGLFAVALTNGWWAIWRGPDLLLRTDNARRSIADRYVKRGSLLDQHGTPINITQGESGTYNRIYLYPDLSPVVGYTHPIYGQAGLESSLDPYLRGLQGNPARMLWLDHLLYGQPPPGLDVRLSIDLELQREVDALLGDHAGAAVLLNADSGEILAMASHPAFDPNKLDEEAQQLTQDPRKPLLNRAAQGTYLPGNALLPFFQAAGITAQSSQDSIQKLYETLGFYSTPDARLPVADAPLRSGDLRLSPLQLALAAAGLSHEGQRPAPRLAMAVNTPLQGWVILPSPSEPVQMIAPDSAAATAERLMVSGQPFWDWTAQVKSSDQPVTWYLAGTLPEWKGSPLALVLILEEDNPALITDLGQEIMRAVIHP